MASLRAAWPRPASALQGACQQATSGCRSAQESATHSRERNGLVLPLGVAEGSHTLAIQSAFRCGSTCSAARAGQPAGEIARSPLLDRFQVPSPDDFGAFQALHQSELRGRLRRAPAQTTASHLQWTGEAFCRPGAGGRPSSSVRAGSTRHRLCCVRLCLLHLALADGMILRLLPALLSDLPGQIPALEGTVRNWSASRGFPAELSPNRR